MNIYKNIHCRQIFRTVVLLLLFVCSIQSTWADEVIFSMTNVTGPTDKLAASESAAVQATFTGGSAIVYNGHA